MNPCNWNLNSMANYAGLLLQCSTIKRAAWFRRNWCRKNKHTISSVSSAIWARFRSTKHATSTRIWTWSIIPPKCSMFWRARQRINNQCCWQNLSALKKCGHRRQDKNLSWQNLSFDFVETIPVLSASADRIGPMASKCFHCVLTIPLFLRNL